MLTKPSSPALSVDALLAHKSWLRALVIELVGEQDADDVLQETWMAALRSPPRSGDAARSWLRRVACRFAWRRHDRDRRWRQRLRAAARPEALRATDDMLAEVQAQREVVEAVAGLAEPYRSAVLWRYLDAVPVADIARRRNVATSTVRTWLSRGLEHLRARLSAKHGRGWHALVALPILRGVILRGAASAPGVLIMAQHTKLTFSALAACLLGFGLYALWPATPESPAPVPTNGGAPAVLVAAEEERSAEAPPLERTALQDPPRHDQDGAAPVRALGTVRDDRGQPVADVPLFFALPAWGPHPHYEPGTVQGEPIALSAADGGFAVPLPDAPCDVVGGEAWVTLRGAPVDPRRPAAERFAVVAPRVTVRGRIVDDVGRGIEGAMIGANADDLGAFPGSLEATAIRPSTRVRSAADGAFTHDRVPGTTQAVLRVEKPGYRQTEWAWRAEPNDAVVIVLQRHASDDAELLVRVVDPLDQPVPGALVTFGEQRRIAGSDGTVRLAWLSGGWLSACAEGLQPFEDKAFDRAAWKKNGSPVPLLVKLPGPALRISGVVLAADGQPVAGMGLAIADAIMLVGERRPAEQRAAGGGEEVLGWEHTDDRGRFSLGGLAARTYTLRFFQRETLLSLTTEPIAAGTDGVIVRVPERAVRRPLRATVTDPDGAPLAGLEVRILNQICQIPASQLTSDWVTTDEHGAFELPVAPRYEGWVQLRGDAISPLTLGLDAWAHEEAPIIVVSRRCLVRFLAALDPSVADMVMPFDADGRNVQMLALQKGDPRPHGWWSLADGRSPELAIPQSAVELWYYKGRTVVKKEPLRLVPGGVVEVQL